MLQCNLCMRTVIGNCEGCKYEADGVECSVPYPIEEGDKFTLTMSQVETTIILQTQRTIQSLVPNGMFMPKILRQEKKIEVGSIFFPTPDLGIKYFAHHHRNEGCVRCSEFYQSTGLGLPTVLEPETSHLSEVEGLYLVQTVLVIFAI